MEGDLRRFGNAPAGLIRDHRDHAMLRSVVALCREIKVATIAEMIETRAQAEWLGRMRVTHGQGYLWGRPSPYPPGA